MKKRLITLKQIIINYTRKHKGFMNAGRIERMAEGYGFKGSTASRMCRFLVVDGFLARELRQGKHVKSVWYKAI